MNVTHSIDVSREIPASAEAIWARISEHEKTHTWVLEARVRLLKEGEGDRNGLNAVREVSFPTHKLWSAIQERVLSFEPAKGFSYKIIAGMPGIRDHLGTVSIEPLGDGKNRLRWHVDFEFIGWHPMGWIAGSFTKTFKGVLDAAVEELRAQLTRT